MRNQLVKIQADCTAQIQRKICNEHTISRCSPEAYRYICYRGGGNNAWMSGKQDCFSMNGTGTDKNAAASPRCGSVSANL